MVALVNIFNNIIKKKGSKDSKDVDYLLEICKKFPSFDLPHILLLNYQPDIFNQDLWKKGEELSIQYKYNLKHYFEPEHKETANDANGIKNQVNLNSFDQKSILLDFLNKPKPKFI
ncbi:hypothetical protein EGI22_03575 [Lacihabitans sp. LS3-19]|uniref:hypothetical protein n=1 Tax=Lacihabitans sp. LS3-19 TaxID=2487335 RepID=UPI0020CE5F26|nr:hypothetical protein [Lacihabitans sp. LS3-19]MCP9766975.1 hypothetical protein [Lacihabitans sp. LS3-19]